MNSLQIIFQVITAILTIYAIFQKQKWKMMLIYTINNILSAMMYMTFNRIASMVICFVAAFRTAVYMFYSLKKLKPNFVWLMIFEVGFIVSTILTWQDALDLMPMFALLIVGYGSWQDNQLILRTSYVINKTLYLIFKAVIGAYISMTVEAVALICTIVGLIYYCILKKETPFWDLVFRRHKKCAVATDGQTEALETNISQSENETENAESIDNKEFSQDKEEQSNDG